MRALCRWMTVAVLLSLAACASQDSEREFRLESGEAVRFLGNVDDERFIDGRAAYLSSNSKTVFDGRFDDKGYPHSGHLAQTLLGEGSELYSLQLIGEFTFDQQNLLIDFLGDFTLVDSQGRVVAEGKNSRWQAPYDKAHPYLSPGNFGLDGKNQYRQYRRHIPLAAEKGRLIEIHRPLAGPFLVDSYFWEGQPQGRVNITAENVGGKSYVVERQYHSGGDDSKQYFYYEPGSFSEIELMGACNSMPTLTVPQNILKAFAYDCEKTKFLAVSPLFKAARVEIHLSDLDNSGSVRRLVVKQKDSNAEMNIDPKALYEGELIPEGTVLKTRADKLISYSHFYRGHAVGIGIDGNAESPHYLQSKWPEADQDMPPKSLLDGLKTQYAAQQKILDNLDVSKASASKDKNEPLKKQLLSAYSEDVSKEDDDISGLQASYQRWQHDGTAKILGWWHGADGSLPGLKQLKKDLQKDLEKWWQQSQNLVHKQAALSCAVKGLSLNDADWQCHLKPSKKAENICHQYYGKSTCNKMLKSLTRKISR